ncbi:RNA polymerase sigma factor [Psychroflexus sp. ALD_RP9]|uniref:RNA polymerase sigma factor n=1 Tax=Psychroflexus sp. ALD_RP9 TaxID=2777186 RepID=UPI001A8E070D|nr:RNA polymerase sigma factor [Psychroflexus sp. ALD_RP9]QSS97202.1 RNA polymerase sigma factor [Psychroflexus sp. ALD_RP9]
MFKNKLIKDCIKQKPKAQLKLYNLYCDAMLNVAMRYIKQRDIAEDVTQEAFIKAFKHLSSFTGEVSFGAWLKRIVINQSIDYCRKLKFTDELHETNLKVIDTGFEDAWQVENHITVKQVTNALEAVPEKYAIILKLYLIEGYDHEEISEILNIKANNSRILLYRGKKHLQNQLKQLNNERFA